MARFGNYETTRELSAKGLTSVYLAQRVGGGGPPVAAVKVLRLPGGGNGNGNGGVGGASARWGGASAGTKATVAAAGPSAAPPAGANGHDVFLSHSTEDKAAADAICGALESAGVRCWIAPRDILPGSNWASSILKAIADSRAMVLVFSQHANSSPHIRREVERAVHHGVPIAPIRLVDVMPQDDLEYFLSASHWMDAITPPLEQHLPRMAEDVRALVSRLGDGAAGTTAAPSGERRAGAGAGAAARAAAAQFLEAAGIQQQAARASPYWSPVHESGESADGAYYVTSHFPRSVEQLIDAGARPTSAELQALLGQVVQGLIDLETSLARPHGDLKPSNVLLRHSRVDAPGSVALADPLPTAQLTPRHNACADLHALGRILGWLVVGREAGGEPVPSPAEASPAWAALGRSGDEWRGLFNTLLNPHPPAGFGLEDVKARIDAIRTGKSRAAKRSRLPVGLAAAAGVAAVVAAPLWIYVVRPRIANSAWLGARPPAGQITPALSRPTTASSTGRSQPVRRQTVKDRLMDVTNPSPAFQVKVTPRVASLGPSGGQCTKFTVTLSRPAYLILLSRDVNGNVDVLLPNKDAPGSIHAEAGATELPPYSAEYCFYPHPPYGRTAFKLIASTTPIELLGPHVGNKQLEDPYDVIDGLQAFTIQGTSGTMRRGGDLSKLLGEDEWATAEAELITTPDEGATAGGDEGVKG
jgi:TIR domain/Domain of unknown function (DUF4384)